MQINSQVKKTIDCKNSKNNVFHWKKHLIISFTSSKKNAQHITNRYDPIAQELVMDNIRMGENLG